CTTLCRSLEACGPCHRPNFAARFSCEEFRRSVQIRVSLVTARTPERIVRPNGVLSFATFGTLPRVRFRFHFDRDTELGGGVRQTVDERAERPEIASSRPLRPTNVCRERL